MTSPPKQPRTGDPTGDKRTSRERTHAKRGPAAQPGKGRGADGAGGRSSEKKPLTERGLGAAILADVLDDGLSLDAAESARRAQIAALQGPDGPLMRAAVRAALRRLGDVDAAIGAHLARPLPPSGAAARASLRLAAAELLFLATPDHAAVDGAVTAVKAAAPRFAGLTNAVLRKVARDHAAAGGPAPNNGEITTAAARRNAPAWLLHRLTADWGEETALAIAAAHLAPPPLDLTPRRPADAPALADALGAETTPLGGVRVRASGAVPSLPGFAEGRWWVQDAAASAPVRLAPPAPAGGVAADLCAAPGGKTLQLAAAGWRVHAVDSSAPRLAALAENLTRTGLTAEIHCADARRWRSPEPLDLVLVDAPCSATGTLRRHPDAARVKDLSAPDALRALTALQEDLIAAAWALLKPGGRMIFCTCSLFREEGERRADAFLAQRPDARPAPEPAWAAAAGFRTGPGWLRTLPSAWPKLGGVDGFFAAAFDKAAVGPQADE